MATPEGDALEGCIELIGEVFQKGQECGTHKSQLRCVCVPRCMNVEKMKLFGVL